MTWTVKDVTYYVSLETDLTGTETYETGTYGPNAAGTGFSYTPTGTTKGAVTEGADGGIAWEVPKAAQGALGKVLTAPGGASFQLVQNGLGGGVLLFGDESDPEAGKSYEVGKCEGLTGSAAPPATTAPTAPTVPTATTPQAAPVLPLTLVTKSVKARKGMLALKLKASGAVTQVAARVRKGSKVVRHRQARLDRGRQDRDAQDQGQEGQEGLVRARRDGAAGRRPARLGGVQAAGEVARSAPTVAIARSAWSTTSS